MANCQVCRIDEMEWAWQPFGPSETPDCFNSLGWHYRGFPVIRVCNQCRLDFYNNLPLDVTYKGQRYIIHAVDGVLPIPAFVEDVLLYWEEHNINDRK